jgi:hypothetical protein
MIEDRKVARSTDAGRRALRCEADDFGLFAGLSA